MGAKDNAINVDGFNPALPPGMSERASSNGHMATNGHGTFGDSMWSMAVQYPSED